MVREMMGFGWGGFGILGLFFMVLFWFLVIWAIVALVRYFAHTNYHEIHEDTTPLEIIKERYAKGEIKKDEYEQMKKDLS